MATCWWPTPGREWRAGRFTASPMKDVRFVEGGSRQYGAARVDALAHAERLVEAARSGGHEVALADALTARFDALRELIEAAGSRSAEAVKNAGAMMAPLADDNVEHLVTFDNTGRVLAHYRGEANEVGFPPEDLPPGKTDTDQWHGAIIAHTHPRDPDRPFHGLSPDDIEFYAELQPSIGAVVYEWQGTKYWQMLSAQADWPDPVIARIELTLGKIDAERAPRRSADDPMHVALPDVAARLKLDYTREKLE
jgi:hypothetical protein